MNIHDTGTSSLLLGSEEVPPVLEKNTGSASPFLLICDHYGRLIPRGLAISASPKVS